jgi:hypothetical protein
MTKVEEGASNEWLEPVTDAEYDKLPASSALLSVTDAEYIGRFEAFAYGKDHFQDRSAIFEVKCDGLSSLRSARNWPAMQITIKGDRSLPKIK